MKAIAIAFGLFLFLFTGFQSLEAKRHSRTNISFVFAPAMPQPCYRETYVVHHTYGHPRPVCMRPIPRPVYYREVHYYEAPCYPPCSPWYGPYPY